MNAAVSFPGVYSDRRCETDHSIPSSDEIINKWSYNSLSLYAFIDAMGMTVKALFAMCKNIDD
jgi:hypothetical protein